MLALRERRDDFSLSRHQHEAPTGRNPHLSCANISSAELFVYSDFSSRLSVSFQRSSINVCLVFVVPPCELFFQSLIFSHTKKSPEKIDVEEYWSLKREWTKKNTVELFVGKFRKKKFAEDKKVSRSSDSNFALAARFCRGRRPRPRTSLASHFFFFFGGLLCKYRFFSLCT